MKVTETGPYMRVDVPEYFKREDFLRWLNDPTTATWHKKGGRATQMSDAFVTYDNGEGSDACGMPEDCWEALCAAARAHGMTYGLIWLTNLKDW